MTEVALTKIPQSKPVMTLIEDDAAAVAIKMTVGVEQDGVDLTDMAWTVNYANATGTAGSTVLSDVEAGEETIELVWAIPAGFTDKVGTAKFQVVGADTGMQWSSAVYWCNVTAAL